MRELQRTDRLSIATVIFVVVIAIGFLTMNEPDLKYTQDFSAAALDAGSPAMTITPENAYTLLQENSPSAVFIDIRNIYDYDKGHLGNALHIPKVDLLDAQNLKSLDGYKKENKEVILYGSDQLDAQAPAMLLREIGYDNVKVLMGGYRYMKTHAASGTMRDSTLSYQDEKPRYNFAEMTSSPSATEVESRPIKAPEVVLPVRKVKSGAEGGC